MKANRKGIAATATIVMSLWAFFNAVPARAVYAPSWERPVKQAEMIVLESEGFFNDAENVVLTQNRRSGFEKEASSFTLSFDLLNKDGSSQKMSYQIPVEDVSYDRCGGTEFVASLKLHNVDREIHVRIRRQTAMGVQRACGGRAAVNGPETSWNVEVIFVEPASLQSESRMTLRGFPSSVYTIQEMETF